MGCRTSVPKLTKAFFRGASVHGRLTIVDKLCIPDKTEFLGEGHEQVRS